MDCLIVGGGLIGMMIARELARAGLGVRVLERGEFGRESSWAGGGILSPLCPWEAPEPLTRLAQWSQRYYPGIAAALLDETGVDAEWVQSGLLVLDTGASDRALSWARAQGVRLEILDGRAAVAAVEPQCRPANRALWLREVAQVRNPRLIRALARSLEHGGAVLSGRTEVDGIVRQGGRVRGVRTASGVLEADIVVIAGGAWSAGLLSPLDLNIEIAPVKGQMLMYRAAPGLIGRILCDGDHYVIPRRDGHVLVGSTLEYAGFDKSTTAEARKELQGAAVSLVPGLVHCEVVQQWAGLRPGSPAGIPFIGSVPGIQGLYLSAGHFRNGVLLAPASARLLADIILGRSEILDPAPYAVK